MGWDLLSSLLVVSAKKKSGPGATCLYFCAYVEKEKLNVTERERSGSAMQDKCCFLVVREREQAQSRLSHQCHFVLQDLTPSVIKCCVASIK